MLDLWRRNWCGIDRVTHTEDLELAEIDVLFAGFECDDGNVLSCKSADGAIEEAAGRTGSIGRATLEFIIC